MQILGKNAATCVAGGMTVEKYDESTQALFESVRAQLRDNLERLEKLEPLIKQGYAQFNSMPDEL